MERAGNLAVGNMILQTDLIRLHRILQKESRQLRGEVDFLKQNSGWITLI